jgi:hypothetical protein
MSHEDDGRIALEQEIADLRFALRQATDRASLAEVKCSQLLSAGMLTDAERAAVMWAIGSCEIEQTIASDAADRGYKLPDTREWAAKHGERAAALRGLLERMGGRA